MLGFVNVMAIKVFHTSPPRCILAALILLQQLAIASSASIQRSPAKNSSVSLHSKCTEDWKVQDITSMYYYMCAMYCYALLLYGSLTQGWYT
jgi:hypothetical protein